MIDMAIITVSNLKDFAKWATALDPKRYRLIITEHKEVICRPSVTTSRVDTIYFQGDSGSMIDEIVKHWEGNVFHCEKFIFDETKNVRFYPKDDVV